MIYGSVLDAIGHTPLIRLDVGAPDGVDVYAKLEMQNLFAMKDRVALNCIKEAKRRGTLADGAVIVESSSGTMALGVALVGTMLGHPVHIVTDPRIDPVTEAKLRTLGCSVHVVQKMSAQGWQSSRLEKLAQIMDDNPGAFWPRQYTNPDNPAAYRMLADELLTDLGHLDVLVGAVGSGGSLCGTSRALRSVLPDLRVIGVDCVGSVLFGQPDWPQRLQSGLGNSLHPTNLDESVLDEVHWLSDAEAFTSTRELAGEQKIFAGNTSGSVYRVLRELAGHADPRTRLVGIFPDRGDRYATSVYSQDYWAEHGLVEVPYGTVPARRVRPGTVVSQWSYRVDRPGRVLAVIEANTTGTGMIALRAAANLGLRPVFLTNRPERYRGLADTNTEVIRCDTNDLTALHRVLRSRWRASELSGITTTSEYYLSAVAALAEEFGVIGNSVTAVARCRDKFELRRLLSASGLSSIRFRRIERVEEVADVVAEVGLPCVVKPVDESGSVGVRRCATASEAAEQAAALLTARVNGRVQPRVPAVLVEEYLDGPEYSVEMIMADGVPMPLGITEKTVSHAPYFVEQRHLYPADVWPELAAEFHRAAGAAVLAIGLQVGAVHVELRRTVHGPVVIEVNARLAGGMIPDLVRLTSGLDLVEAQVRAFTGMSMKSSTDPVSPRVRYPKVAGIQFIMPRRAGVVREVCGVVDARRVPGVESVVLTVAQGDGVAPPVDALGRVGHVIAHGETHGEVVESLAEAVEAIRVEVGVEDGRRSA